MNGKSERMTGGRGREDSINDQHTLNDTDIPPSDDTDIKLYT